MGSEVQTALTMSGLLGFGCCSWLGHCSGLRPENGLGLCSGLGPCSGLGLCSGLRLCSGLNSPEGSEFAVGSENAPGEAWYPCYLFIKWTSKKLIHQVVFGRTKSTYFEGVSTSPQMLKSPSTKRNQLQDLEHQIINKHCTLAV